MTNSENSDADRAMRAQAAPAVAAADVLEQIANEPPINGNNLAAARVMMAAQMLRDQITEAAAAPQPAVQQGDELPREDFAWLVVQEACETEPADEDDPECIRILRRDLKSAVLSAFLRHDAAHPAAPVAQGDALTDTYVQQVPDKCDRIVWRGRYYHLPIDAAEHSYTEPSPMAKVAAALRQKAEQEDAAYQARRSDQGLMESEWGPMEDAPPHEDPPMHVAVVEGDDTVRTLQWNRDVAAFAYPAGTLLYAAHPAAPVAQGDAMTYEQQRAIRQGHEIAASDSYFDARPQIDNNDRRKVFEAGFERGWDAARSQAKEGA